MRLGKVGIFLAGYALLAGGTFTWAEENVTDLSLQPKYLDEAPATAPAPTPDKPLMGMLGKAGLAQPLKDMGINIYGFVEGGYTYSWDSTANHVIPGRVFDYKQNEPLLNQLDLSIERTVDLKKFDVGGKIEAIYGTDAGLTHSYGLLDGYTASRAFGAAKDSPEYQLDLVQAYVDLAIPVGNGIDLKVGKFVTCHGQETINPTTNALYSHSYLFGYAIPFAHTGALATYAINDNWSVSGGFSRGWEQALDDTNDSIDGIGVIKYTTTDKKLSVALNAISGPETAGNNTDYRTCLDIVVNYAATDKLTFAINGDYAWDDGAATGSGHQAKWYGVAGYTGYAINDYLTVNGRVEWFQDDSGVRLGTGVETQVYEVTVGLGIKPCPKDDFWSNLLIRPEVRYDHSSVPVFGSDFTQENNVTFAIDAIFTF